MFTKSPVRQHPNLLFHWLAALVLFLAALLRIVALQDVPPGLAQDEVLNADIASFIRSGHHALFFREGYGHEPLYHYWAVPFQLLLGDNVLSIRLPAIFLGLFLVAAVLQWARRDFGSVVAITAGMGLAVSWWPVIFSRIGLRPILEPLLLVPMAYFWRRRPWISGLCMGLSFYTYTAARVLFLVPILYGVYAVFVCWKEATSGNYFSAVVERIRPAAVVLIIAAAIYLPLGLLLRSDPSLQQRVQQLDEPLRALRQGNARPVLETALATLGVFSFTGDPRWTYTIPGTPLFGPVTAVCFYIGILLALFRSQQFKYGFILVWLSVALLPSALTPQAPSSVRLVGSMPVVYLLPGIAVDWLYRKAIQLRPPASDRRRMTSMVVAGALLLLSLNVVRTIRDGFVLWPAELETRLKYQSVLLDMSRQWKKDTVVEPVVATSFYEPIDNDSLRRNLGRENEARWVQTGADVAGAMVFPRLSVPGTVSQLYVPEYAAPSIALMQRAGIDPEPRFRSIATPSFAIYDIPVTPPVPTVSVGLSFESLITLVGYDLEPVQEGMPLQAYSYWLVNGELPHDLAIFVHLLRQDGKIASQHDAFDAAASTLRVGDSFIQRHLLPKPEEVSSGPYTLQLGLYQRGDLHRLRHAGAPDDRIILKKGWTLTEHE